MEIIVDVIKKITYSIPVEGVSYSDTDELIKAAYNKYCELEDAGIISDYMSDSDLEYQI